MSRAGNIPLPGGRSAGFTLIELLVVLTVIALIAALATPMIQRSVPGLELKTAAEGLRSELRLVRAEAIRDNRETWLTVDVEAGTYRREAGRLHKVPEEIRLSLLTARRELVDAAEGRIRFYPDGTSTGGALRLERGERGYEVAIDWFDGRVSIDETHAE